MLLWFRQLKRNDLICHSQTGVSFKWSWKGKVRKNEWRIKFLYVVHFNEQKLARNEEKMWWFNRRPRLTHTHKLLYRKKIITFQLHIPNYYLLTGLQVQRTWMRTVFRINKITNSDEKNCNSSGIWGAIVQFKLQKIITIFFSFFISINYLTFHFFWPLPDFSLLNFFLFTWRKNVGRKWFNKLNISE